MCEAINNVIKAQNNKHKYMYMHTNTKIPRASLLYNTKVISTNGNLNLCHYLQVSSFPLSTVMLYNAPSATSIPLVASAWLP